VTLGLLTPQSFSACRVVRGQSAENWELLHRLAWCDKSLFESRPRARLRALSGQSSFPDPMALVKQPNKGSGLTWRLLVIGLRLVRRVTGECRGGVSGLIGGA
jgi:hypothetical protein